PFDLRNQLTFGRQQLWYMRRHVRVHPGAAVRRRPVSDGRMRCRRGGAMTARLSLLIAAGVLGLPCFSMLGTACAASDEALSGSNDAGNTLPGTSNQEGDTSSDASNCGADAFELCEGTNVDCEGHDWCPETGAVDGLYALTNIWGTSASDVWAVG